MVDLSRYTVGIHKIIQVNKNELRLPGILYIWLIREIEAPTLQNRNAALPSRHPIFSVFFRMTYTQISCPRTNGKKAKTVFTGLENSSQLWAMMSIIPRPISKAPRILKTITSRPCDLSGLFLKYCLISSPFSSVINPVSMSSGSTFKKLFATIVKKWFA